MTKEDERSHEYRNRLNAGQQIIDPVIPDMSGINPDQTGTEIKGMTAKAGMDRQVRKLLCGTDRMYCYDNSVHCKDMGTPERLKRLSGDLQNGTLAAKNEPCRFWKYGFILCFSAFIGIVSVFITK